MKVVKETKRASVKQMEAMASNLRDKLNCHTTIEIEARAYDEGLGEKTQYTLYVKDEHHYFKTWKEMVDFYKKLISS